MFHNRYLPRWIHRVANGAIGSVLSLLLAVAAFRIFGVPLWVIWLVLPAAIICVASDPQRFSLVERLRRRLGLRSAHARLGHEVMFTDGMVRPPASNMSASEMPVDGNIAT